MKLSDYIVAEVPTVVSNRYSKIAHDEGRDSETVFEPHIEDKSAAWPTMAEQSAIKAIRDEVHGD